MSRSSMGNFWLSIAMVLRIFSITMIVGVHRHWITAASRESTAVQRRVLDELLDDAELAVDELVFDRAVAAAADLLELFPGDVADHCFVLRHGMAPSRRSCR